MAKDKSNRKALAKAVKVIKENKGVTGWMNAEDLRKALAKDRESGRAKSRP